MEKSAPYFLTGLFVSVLALAMAGFLIWLISPHDNKKYVRYTVYFTDSVSGLRKDADVYYKGVDVGKVVDLRLSAQRTELIRADIEVAEDTPVHSQTKATLGMLGMTGLIYMELTTAPGDTQPPQRRQGETYPVLEGSGTQVSQILENLNKFSTQGLEQIISVSRDIQAMAESIRKLSDRIKQDPSQILYQQPSSGVEIPK